MCMLRRTDMIGFVVALAVFCLSVCLAMDSSES